MSIEKQSPTLGMRPRLALPVGDPAGIGPEVVLKALADPRITSACEVIVVGNASLLGQAYQQLCDRCRSRAPLSPIPLAHPQDMCIVNVDLEAEIERQIITGQGNAASGAASFAYLEKAIALTLSGDCDGIVTAPIAKSAWKAAGHDYPGQTELLAQRAGVQRFGMLFVARSPHSDWVLRTLLATTHIPLRQVPDTLNADLLTAKLDLLLQSLHQDFGLITPRIAVAGLNPHSGEQGQLGREEQDWLIPWITQQRQHLLGSDRLAQIDGPVPPDTLWVKPGQAWYGKIPAEQAHDAYLALYHDQGLIPVKLMAFDQAVNTTIGLPFIRTSPDHGTAFDIAGQGIADASSLKAALQLAVEMVQQRRQGI